MMRSSTVSARLLCAVIPAALAAVAVVPAAAEQMDAAVAAEGEPLESADFATIELQPDVLEYQRAVAELEDSEGAFAASLPEQLLGLGLALQRNGDHPGAIDAFKRGTHLARINEGLYSSRQLALLRGEIESLVAIGDLEGADERQRYLYRVQERTLSDRSRGEALMRQALWQRQAFEAGLGEVPEERLLRMWSLYRLALTDIAGAEGQESRALLPPLYGMLRSQYLLSGFVGETSTGSYRDRYAMPEQDQLGMSYRSSTYKQGMAVIRAIYDVRQVTEGKTLRASAEPTIMLADWHLWHGKREEAFETYGALERELAAIENAQELYAELFAQPQPLPALEGVRAFPAPQEHREGLLLLEFGVTARGRVVDLQRLDDNPGNDAQASNVMRRLRQTVFRPRISDGMPVDTPDMVVAYDISQW